MGKHAHTVGLVCSASVVLDSKSAMSLKNVSPYLLFGKWWWLWSYPDVLGSRLDQAAASNHKHRGPVDLIVRVVPQPILIALPEGRTTFSQTLGSDVTKTPLKTSCDCLARTLPPRLKAAFPLHQAALQPSQSSSLRTPSTWEHLLVGMVTVKLILAPAHLFDGSDGDDKEERQAAGDGGRRGVDHQLETDRDTR